MSLFLLSKLFQMSDVSAANNTGEGVEWLPAVNCVTLLETFYLLTPPFILSCSPSCHSVFPLKIIVIMFQPFHTPSSAIFLCCIDDFIPLCGRVAERFVYV